MYKAPEHLTMSQQTSIEISRRVLEKTTRLAGILFLLVFALTFLLPLYWMFTGSFKLQAVTMAIPPELFPSNPTLENWSRLFTGPWPVWRWVLNSVTVSLLTVVLVLLVSCRFTILQVAQNGFVSTPPATSAPGGRRVHGVQERRCKSARPQPC